MMLEIKKKTNRQAGLELLRILAMLLIVTQHLAEHTTFPEHSLTNKLLLSFMLLGGGHWCQCLRDDFRLFLYVTLQDTKGNDVNSRDVVLFCCHDADSSFVWCGRVSIEDNTTCFVPICLPWR